MKNLFLQKVNKKYEKFITSVTEPHSDTHIDLLKADNHIVIREHLLYKKFRYVVNFRRTWHTQITDIDEWVWDNFSSLIASGDIRWVDSGYNPRLYITNTEDLVLVKLTWGERIREITTIHLLSEV